jgi:hypothetical protein
MSTQTAVEYLHTQIIRFHNWKRNPIYDENCFDEIELYKAVKQAKEMERKQIADAVDGFPVALRHLDGEAYYNAAYKGGDNAGH